MVKKRLIFILYYYQGYFYLSRNFILQKVGDINWLLEKFKFKNIGDVIDEIVFINVDRNRPSVIEDAFFRDIERLLESVLVPFAIGGGINSTKDIDACFKFGSDKVIFTTAFFNKVELLNYTRNNYGNQALIINIDYKIEAGKRFVFTNNGSEKKCDFNNHLDNVVNFKPGEIILNSITNDGTGYGFDLEIIDQIKDINTPVIIAGGAGKPEHFQDVLIHNQVSAGATGNLFNFLGDGFTKVRKYLIESNINVRNLEI